MDGYDLHEPAHVLYIRTSGSHSYDIIKKNMEFVINLTTKTWLLPPTGAEFVGT